MSHKFKPGDRVRHTRWNICGIVDSATEQLKDQYYKVTWDGFEGYNIGVCIEWVLEPAPGGCCELNQSNNETNNSSEPERKE